jgi:hypothetical protein
MAFFFGHLRDKICNSLLNDSRHQQCYYCYAQQSSNQQSLCYQQTNSPNAAAASPIPNQNCCCCQSLCTPQIQNSFQANYRYKRPDTPVKLGTQTLIEIEDEVKKVESLMHRTPIVIKEKYEITGAQGRLLKVKIPPPNHKTSMLIGYKRKKKHITKQQQLQLQKQHQAEKQPALFRDITINQAIDLKVIHFAGFPVIFTYVLLLFYVISLFFHIAVWHYMLCLRFIVQLSLNAQ